MKKKLNITINRPQYFTITDLTFAQVPSWFNHCKKDLKLDLIYPQYTEGKKLPCIVWICGGGWLEMEKSAHLAQLVQIAREGFVVASVQYRTSNEAKFPSQLQDVKAAIRYLKAHAEEFNINPKKFGVSGESAGGFLACHAALNNKKAMDTGDYLEQSSKVQCAVPWYPPTDFSSFPKLPQEFNAASPESLLAGFALKDNDPRIKDYSPVDLVTKKAPPFLIIHGNKDQVVPFQQSQILYEKLEAAGANPELIEIEGANHADIQFFQDEIIKEMTEFFKKHLN